MTAIIHGISAVLIFFAFMFWQTDAPDGVVAANFVLIIMNLWVGVICWTIEGQVEKITAHMKETNGYLYDISTNIRAAMQEESK